MQFICQQKDFLRGVAAVERAVAQRDIKPILTGIYLQTKDNQLHLAGSDLEIRIEASVPVETIQEGKLVVEGRYLASIIRKLSPGDIKVTYDSEKKLVYLQSGRAKLSLHTIAGDDFPPAPDMEEESNFPINQELLQEMIKQTSFAAAAVEEIRPFLRGVFLTVKDGQFAMVATDSNRLAIRQEEVSLSDFEALIPARTLNELNRLLTEEWESIHITLGSNQILFSFGGIKLYSRLISSTFPDYNRVLPKHDPSTTLLVNRVSLESAIERVSLMVRKGPAMIDFKVNDGMICLSIRSSDVGDGLEDIDVVQTGADVQVCLQARYLCDALRVIDEDQVNILLYPDNGPVIVKVPEKDSFTYLVMPVRT